MRKQRPPQPRKEWASPIGDYHLLSDESCKLLMEQAKSYFEETIKESEELTQRSANMLFLLLPGIAAVVGYCISNQEKLRVLQNLDVFLIIVSIICLGFCLYNLFALISPKEIHYRGAKPEEAIRPEIFALGNPAEVEKALFVSELERYQIKIENMEFWNYERIFLYRDVVISFNMLLIFGIALLARAI